MFRRHPPSRDEALVDEELAERAQCGQREAFGALYDRYLPHVYRYCFRLLGNREAAEDANSRVFMNALAALPTFQTRSFRSWLFAIAHNVVVDELRARRVSIPLEFAVDLLDPAPSPEAAAIAAIERHAILALRLAGLSAVEIGEVLGKPRNAVDGLQHRAVLRLQALLAAGAGMAPKGGPLR